MAAAGASPLRLDLPAGSLGSAIAILSDHTGASIFTLDASLLAIRLPALHLEGSSEAVLARVARDAGVTLVRTGPQSWRITRAAPPSPPKRPPPQAAVAEVVVQATKRAELLSDYPAEIVRVSGADLDRYGGAADTGALSALAPILTSTDWGAGQEKLFLRGIADSSFTGASPALVGEYLGDLPLTYDAPDPDLRLYDVSSVEMLAGPQGTLYGAGALAGVIRIEPNAPVLDRTSGSVWLGGTNTDHGANGGDIGGVFNLPLVEDKLALRAVGYAEDDGGYIDDLERGLKDVNETQVRGGRIALRWAPIADWTVDVGGVAQRIANRDAAYVNTADPAWTRSSAMAQPSTDTFVSGNATVSGRLGGVNLRSTSGFVDQSTDQVFEVLPHGVTGRFDEQERTEQASEELRLSGGSSGATWVVGLSYLAEWETSGRDYQSPPGPPLTTGLHDRSNDLTGYGELTHKIIGRLSATFGLRYVYEDLSGDVITDQSPYRILRIITTDMKGSERHLLPSAALSYQLDRDTTLYIRDGSGVRLGGLTPSNTAESYASDRLTTQEIGLRRGVAGRDRIALSVSGAYSQWNNIQAGELDTPGLPFIANIGDGRVYSLDATGALRLVEGLNLQASGFLASSHLNPSPILSDTGVGSSLPDVAHNGGVATLDYQGLLFGGPAFEARMRVQHVGPSLFGVGNLLARPQGDYTTVGLGGGLRFGAASVLLNVSNLLDSHSSVFAIGTPFVVEAENDVTPLRPRTTRLGLRYDF